MEIWLYLGMWVINGHSSVSKTMIPRQIHNGFFDGSSVNKPLSREAYWKLFQYRASNKFTIFLSSLCFTPSSWKIKHNKRSSKLERCFLKYFDTVIYQLDLHSKYRYTFGKDLVIQMKKIEYEYGKPTMDGPRAMPDPWKVLTTYMWPQGLIYWGQMVLSTGKNICDTW